MLRFNFIYLFIIFSFAVLSTSCSSSSEITTPVSDLNSLEISQYTSIPVVISDWDESGRITAGTGLLGVFQAHIDLENMTGELSSLRQGSNADVIEAIDITGFLTVSPCSECVRLESVAIDISGNLVLSIGIKHPFPMGDPSDPITGKNRADLIVYNVEGIVVTDGDSTNTALGETFHDPLLVNADGLTGYLDNSLDTILNSTATVHPYVLHFDDFLSGNYNPGIYPSRGFPPPPTRPRGNLVMGQGTDYDFKDYIFDLDSTGSFDFIFAVGATYGITTPGKDERFDPVSMVPQHNKKAASVVEVEIVSNDLIYGELTSTADLNISVLDMNHGVAVGAGLDEMLARSDVDEISVMIPGMTSDAVTETNPTEISGSPRDPADPLVFSIQITNSADAAPGDYTGLVKVLDTYSPGLNTNPLLSQQDGIGRVDPSESPIDGLFTITEFATYQVFKITMAFDCGPITGQIDTPSCPILTFVSGETQSFQVSAASENGGGNVILYEMDYDYDGVNFDVDDSNTDGSFVDAGSFVNPNCGTPPEDPVVITVAFRGTDECVPPNVTVFATCDITVNLCELILYLYEPDPSRSSIDLTNGVDQPADPLGELDIGVCENSSEPDFDGVYFFDSSHQISRFDHDYVNSTFQAPGLTPSNDTGTHPAPDDAMPGYRLDVAENGHVISSYWDMNETMDLSQINPIYTDPFPEGDVWVTWKPTIPRPTVIPPVGNDPWPHDPILSQVTMDSGEILENPIAHEGWDESNHVTVSTPASGDPQGPGPYAQEEDVLSVMYRYTNPAFMDPSTGFMLQYYGHYPPYYDGSFYTLYDYAWELTGISADEIKGVDRSDTDWLFLGISGPINQAYWNAGGSQEILFLIDCNDPGTPGWLLDFKESMETLLGYSVDGSILDLECIPYDPASPVTFDDGTGGPADQFAAIAAVLHENSHIYLIAFDSTPGNEAFVLFQDIDGTSAITGTPKHIDVGETTLDIHVTSTDDSIAYATVFSLTAQ